MTVLLPSEKAARAPAPVSMQWTVGVELSDADYAARLLKGAKRSIGRGPRGLLVLRAEVKLSQRAGRPRRAISTCLNTADPKKAAERFSTGPIARMLSPARISTTSSGPTCLKYSFIKNWCGLA